MNPNVSLSHDNKNAITCEIYNFVLLCIRSFYSIWSSFRGLIEAFYNQDIFVKSNLPLSSVLIETREK